MANLDMEPLILWVIGIRLKETDSEASRCRNINVYRKKHRCFKLTATLTYTLASRVKDLQIQPVRLHLHLIELLISTRTR